MLRETREGEEEDKELVGGSDGGRLRKEALMEEVVNHEITSGRGLQNEINISVASKTHHSPRIEMSQQKRMRSETSSDPKVWKRWLDELLDEEEESTS
ncbi:Protein of unknown function [Gryllus bimaculatus]|nr:Protein of unknown function [Gryllus bimaculatus]